MTRATARVSFQGVIDGTIYPKSIAPGDIIEGDLADTAIKYGLAVEGEVKIDDLPPPVDAPKPAQSAGDTGQQDQGANQQAQGSGQQDQPENAAIAIPDDWHAMKDADLIALAEKISGETVDNVDDASAVIELEVEKRAPKQ